MTKRYHHLIQDTENPSIVIMAIEIDGLYYANDTGDYLPHPRFSHLKTLDTEPPSPQSMVNTQAKSASQIAEGLGLSKIGDSP